MARSRPSTSPPPEPPSPALRFLEAIVAALVMIRLLVPPEGSVLGRTLWITPAWFVAALLAVWLRSREGLARRKLDWLDAGVFVLTAGHVLSALRLIAMQDGDRRVALNMLWEWLALAVSFLLLRGVLADASRRAAWQRMMVALAIAFAGLGVWQHYVMYRAEARRYDALRSEFDELRAKAAATPEESRARERRLSELRQEFSRQQIPMEGPARRQFEDRLRGSTEPIGLFALANTFAGWIATWGLVGCGLVAANRASTDGSAPSGQRRWIVMSGLALVAFCLVLTKSRTAWVGTMAGAAVWGGLSWWTTRRLRPLDTATPTETGNHAALNGALGSSRQMRPVTIAAFVGAGIVAVAGLALLTGGLDREVLAQAPRSLRFRLQYWSGTSEVVQERWLWGTGPGNFRPHYLKYKLPEASEEIADPHNLVLDVWTSGGLIGLLGLAWTIAAAVQVARATPRTNAIVDGSPPAASKSESSSTAGRGAAVAFGLMIASIALFGGESDEIIRMVCVAAAWGAAWRVLSGLPAPATRACVTGSATALSIHLLGAGGIEMPAITQTLLLLVVLVTSRVAEETRVAEAATLERFGPVRTIAEATGCVVLCAACLLSATLPVMSCESLLSVGDAEIARGDGVSRPELLYQQASVSDPLNPAPVERLADFYFLRSQQRPIGSRETDFSNAIELGKVTLKLDPHDSNGYRRLGSMWMAQSERTRNAAEAASAAKEAAEWYRQAIERNPNFSALRAECAEAYAAARQPEEAAREAKRALDLDDINRRERHADRIFDEAKVKRLESLVSKAGLSAPTP
jgi:hypothetical protein